MRIVYFEDDSKHSREAREFLEGALPDSVIVAIHTEKAFLELFPDFEASPPDIFILDMMVPWDRGQATKPDDYSEDDFYRAGMRCLKKLSASKATSGIPVILYTVVNFTTLITEYGTLSSNVVYLDKSRDYQDLVIRIRSLVPDLVTDRGNEKSWLEAIMDAIEAKPGFWGVTIDLKKLAKKRKHR